MKITTRLNLIVLVPLILGALVCMVVMLSQSRQKDTALCGHMAVTIGQGISQLNNTAFAYLLAPDPATIGAWKSVHDTLQATLETSPKLSSGAEGILLDAISQNQDMVQRFEALVERVDPTDGTAPDPTRVAEAKEAFLAGTDKMMLTASRLVGNNLVASTAAPANLRLILVGVVVAGMVLYSFATLRRLSGGLGTLQQMMTEWGTKASTGQVKGEKRGDELDVLTSDLVGMTKELRVIREELNAEVKAREDAAGALRGANVQLSETMSRLRRAQAGILQQERVQALRQIARGVVLDVNDALMPLVGISELYRLYPDQLDNHKEVAESFQRIHDAAGRAEKVIRNLATFCSPTAAGLSGRVNLTRVVDEVMAVTATMRKSHSTTGAAPIEIKSELGKVPDFQGDVPDLADALTGILINSIEAMTDGGTITIRIFSEGNSAVLEVADTGPGMLPEVAQRCLEPFFSTKGKGHSGMGLTAAQGAVTRAGGMLNVTTVHGQGTTVTFRLPMTLSPERDGVNGPSSKPLRKLKILAIDDQPWSSHVVERHLKADGHEVKTVASGKDGLESARRDTYDLVLLDRVMPDMNGDEVAAALKASQATLPIIMLTGFGVIMSDHGDTPVGVDFVLSKPVKQADLRNAILRVMKA